MSVSVTPSGPSEPSTNASASRSTDTRWSATTLFTFRVAFAYLTLEWLLLLAMLNTPALTAGVFRGPGWWGTVNSAIGLWPLIHVLALPEHSPARFTANFCLSHWAPSV